MTRPKHTRSFVSFCILSSALSMATSLTALAGRPMPPADGKPSDSFTPPSFSDQTGQQQTSRWPSAAPEGDGCGQVSNYNQVPMTGQQSTGQNTQSRGTSVEGAQ